jgi:hypothetical protein
MLQIFAISTTLSNSINCLAALWENSRLNIKPTRNRLEVVNPKISRLMRTNSRLRIDKIQNRSFPKVFCKLINDTYKSKVRDSSSSKEHHLAK